MKTKVFEVKVGTREVDVVVNFDYDHITESIYIDDFWIQGDDLGLTDEEKSRLADEIEALKEKEQKYLPAYVDDYQNDMAEWEYNVNNKNKMNIH